MGSGNIPHINLKTMAKKNFYETELSIINIETQEEGWSKFIIDLDCICACRPFINDEMKYEHTKIYTELGDEFVIKDDYNEFIKKIK